MSNLKDTYLLDVALGLVSGRSAVHKFGRAPAGIQTTATDVWVRADSGATQQIWLPPTAARVHSVVSTSTSDDGSPVGVGARTLTISGLTSWSSAEVSETITLDGTTPVNTVNSYVMINRMFVATSGSTSINVGTITATAATDGTVTAQINPGRGQTEQCIYGLPSTQKLALYHLRASINASSGAGARADLDLLVNFNPNVQTTNYRNQASVQMDTSGSTFVSANPEIPIAVNGPAIVKIQGTASVADTDCSAAFSGILVTS